MTQLNEILEDDEKLTKMVLEMEEVGESPFSRRRALASSGPLPSSSAALCCAAPASPRWTGGKRRLGGRRSALL